MTTPIRTSNHLAGQKSPYLLQHAQNPVDWYPWGDEAFLKARSEDKPVFLSIGYSTCHWCHVMARESFMDEKVADLLNRAFVAVKVDREERPDVDHVYMNVCQMLTGSGGWPLTVLLTPDKKPFFTGTYFPKDSRFGLPGLYDILDVIASTWSSDRSALEEQADRVYAALKSAGESLTSQGLHDLPKPAPGGTPFEAVIDKAYRDLSQSFDQDNGGFGSAPKFPSVHTLTFLLRYWKRTGQKRALQMVEETLRHAYAGGIYDHVGFGFFRYATDTKWLVPHFEKMLYDQAMMMIAFTDLGLATKKDAYRDVVYEIATFLENEMKSPEGAFWSAVDAESEGEEGKFYVWTPDEVAEVLGPKEGKAYCQVYGITAEGNFHGKSIPNLVPAGGRPDAPARTEVDIGRGGAVSDKNRRKLYAARSLRVHPGVDDKVLTSWNALAIAALARAGRAFNDPAFTDTASECLSFLERNLVKDGEVYARFRDDEVAYRGYLDDYAFLIWAYLEMREATLDTRYLTRALELSLRMVELFWDDEAHGFFVTAKDAEELLVRPKEFWDGAIPSGNSVAVTDLLRVGHLLERDDLVEIAYAAMEALIPAMRREAVGLCHLISAVLYAEGGAQDVVATGRKDDPNMQAMISYINSVFLPHAQVVFAEGLSAPERPTLRICQRKTCGPPLTSVDALQKALLVPPKPQLRS
ncbi:MAG: thioredoxin domain-containing protein [Bacillota bacterium]